MKKIILIALLLLAGASFSYAQQRVTGKVTSKDDGQPVAFATVTVKGTTVATSTNNNGEYEITAPAGATTLTVSFIGMISQDVNIAGRSIIDVALDSEGEMLEESVVTAMGIKKEKKALGYAVQDIKAEELMKNKNLNVINSLSGKIAGVNVTQAGGSAGAGSTIIIRGGTSLERDNQPLFVVDGIIYDNSTPIGGDSGFDGTLRTATTNSNRIMDVNPEDIESMSVLKGPAASALYGSRAAAGVIIITTKKGQEGTVAVNFSSKMNVNWVNRYPEQQSQYTRGQYNVDGTLNTSSTSTSSWGAPFASGQSVYNNIEDFFETSASFDNNVSIAAGNKNGNFYLSASRFDQNGIVPNTGYDRTTIRFNGEQKYGILTVSANTAYSIANTEKTLTSAGLYGSGGGGTMEGVYRWSRNDDMTHWLNPDGTKYRLFPSQLLESDLENPYFTVNRDSRWDKTNRFTGALNIGLKVTNWFDITYRVGYDNYTTKNYGLTYPGRAVRLTYQNGRLSTSDYTYEFLTSNLMLNFNKKFGDFDLGLLLGQTIEDTKTMTERRDGWDFVFPDFYSFDNINSNNKQFQSAQSRKRLMGLYGEARVGYKSMAYLSVTGRNDWSSTLPIDNRSYFYPSVTGSFVFTEVIPKNNVLSFGKIRASWAEVGKDTNPYELTTTLWPSLNFLGGLGVGNHWQRGNTVLKPEKTRSWEIGADIRLFNGRIGIDYTFYSNDSFDQIVAPRLSNTSGYILLSTNVGRILNKGMELSITGTPIQRKDFSWDVTVNLAGNRGKVKDLFTGQDYLYVTDVQVGTARATSFNNNASVNGDYAGVFMGISGSTWKTDPNGNTIVNATNGFPVVYTTNGIPVGDREPTFTGGINNTLRYKDLSLSFLFDLRVGGEIYNGTDYYMTYHGMSKKSENRQSVTVTGVREVTNSDGTKSYTAPQTVTYEAGKMYNISGVQTSGEHLIRTYYQTHYSQHTKNFLTETNWFRLRSLTLSYDFTNLINKKQKIVKSLSASVSGHNLFIITNYDGMDPETSTAGSGVVGSSSVGIDYCSVPSTAGFSFGINIGF